MEKIINIFKENKVYFIWGGVVFILLIVQVGSFIFLDNEINNKNVSNETLIPTLLNEKEEEKEEIVYFYVDIKGEIKKPGVYKMKENDRVLDVIKKAGGLTKDASTVANNLSKKVIDEMVIIIYSVDQIDDFETILKKEEQLFDNCNKTDKNIVNNSCVVEKENTDDVDISDENKLISINNGTKEELLTLPGIGESRALSIIEYRKNNKFTSIEQIKEVSGIGDSLFEKIKDYIVL